MEETGIENIHFPKKENDQINKDNLIVKSLIELLQRNSKCQSVCQRTRKLSPTFY